MGAGYSPKTRLDCSPYFEVGNRRFKNYESASYGMIGFDQALALSCDTFFYRIAYDLWLKEGGNSSDINDAGPAGRDGAEVRPRHADRGRPARRGAAAGSRTGSGRRSTTTRRRTTTASWRSNPPAGTSAFLKQFSREFCVDGYRYRAGDAVNFAIGQGDTTVTPLQLATVYSALSNGGTSDEPRVVQA